MENIYDIAIIGAGAVGSAIARELSRYDINVVLLEANSDVGMGTSKASTAIWHTGFDAKPGSLEATLMRRSYPLMDAFMQEVGSPFERIGGLLIAWNQEQLDTLPTLLEKADQNGVTDVHLISREEVYQREPHLGEGALGGMFVPGEGILCTFTIPLACATQAVVNGVTLKLNFAVKSIRPLTTDDGPSWSMVNGPSSSGYAISNGNETIYTQWIINAAGLYSDEINNHFGHENFKVTPRRGELIVYDKLARPLVNHVLLPVPTILPELLEEEVTATYAGLRAATEHSDYQIALHTEQKYICVGGIRSTGISASLGIAEYVADLLKEGGVALEHKPDFKTIKMPNIGEAFTRPYQSAEWIEENCDYGKIVCHCERVSLGEVNDAVNSDIPATTLDALRRRTRAMQGRCQGFNCLASMNVILSERSERHRPGGSVPGRISTKTSETLRSRRTLPQSDMKNVDVLIIGAGPAGLAAALELKKLGVKDILVAERESEAGGIPRMCGHIGFGLTDLHRVMTGPSYARKYREMAEQAGIKIHTNTTITDWGESKLRKSLGGSSNGKPSWETSEVFFTSPNGRGMIEAKSILLATGVRERPRAARLIPGHRPQGVFTTGSLQRFVYEQGLPVGKRAVIVGAERVSLSVVMTLMHAGVKVLNMITELPYHQLYLPVFLPAKILYADVLARSPILTNTRVSNIFGRQRVEGIEITRLAKSSETSEVSREVIECDTIVFTGDWIPENELARRGDVNTGKPVLGPQVDSLFRTSQKGIFAAGNLLRGVETADWAALEGRGAAQSITQYLENAKWNENRLEVQCEAPLAWICPNVLSPDVRVDRFRFRSNEFRQAINLQFTQAGRVLYQKRFSRLKANDSLNLSGEWVEKVDFAGEPVKLVVQL